VINSVNLQTPSPQKPAQAKEKAQTVSFTAKQPDKTEKKPGVSLKKLAIATVAAVVLAVPIVLAKTPPSKFKSIAALQTKLTEFLNTKVKPLLTKVLGPKASPDAGLNILR
jgi:hypothetical protein